jgi:TnpA family transposase
MPVEFLTDDEAAAYGRYAGVPSQADLERVFFLDDEDRKLVDLRRGEHMKAGFALQLVTVRWLGTFLEDPLDVPGEVLDFVAGQLGLADPSVVKQYAERVKTKSDHQQEIRRKHGLRDFADAEAELAEWVAARAWTSGDGPKAIFLDAMTWLRERKVLLPGVTTLARLVARVRDDTTHHLWRVLEALLTPAQRRVLDRLLEVPPGLRVSDLERWRKGPPPRGSGPAIIQALDQVAEIQGLGLARLAAEAVAPPRRLGELARYGMTADAWLLRRHPDDRRLATLLATARLLEGDAWAAVRADVLIILGLPVDPDALLAGHAQALDAAYREVGGRLSVNTEVSIGDDGKIHLTGVKAIEEPPSLVDLRSRTAAMLPRVDLPEVILEVMSWAPELAASFTPVSGGRSRLDDLPTSVAACLAAHAMNIGYRPIAKKGVPALERARLSHVFQNYVRPETLAAANAPLVARQADLPLAQAWGGGLVAAVDGMRFVVPVPAAFARPNRKFFGSKRGMTWLNAINDHGMGRGAKIVSGTVRDSLHMVDVIFGLDGGELPEIVVSDTGSYSDVVFGLLELLGISYRPALADLPDQKGWRIKAGAGYGPLSIFARGRINTTKIRRNWEDILRVVASIYTGTVRAYDVVTMLQRDGHPTALGEAIAMYGRIFKTLHILSYIDTDETYRRDIKGIRNLQEGRHALARKICHGRKGELYHRYERGLENQLGALGLVLNCVVLWTTVYLDAAVRHLKAQGYLVLDEDMARLSPFVSRHLGVHGTYSFVLPDLAPGAIRELRDPDASDDDDE